MQQPVVQVAPMSQQQVKQSNLSVLIQGKATPNEVPLAMVRPQAPPGTPMGLEYFAVLDRIWVKELPQWWDQISTQEVNQVYHCLTNTGAPLYLVQEASDYCSLQLCGNHRQFIMSVIDPTTRQLVMTLQRPCRLNSPCFFYLLPCNWCFLQDLTVSDCQGQLIGHVTQPFAFKGPTFHITDELGQHMLSINSPLLTFSCLGDVCFPVLNNQGQQIGHVTKKWGGVVREEFLTNEDNFACEFPMDLPIKAKALIFASTFLIDYMYFLDRNKKKPDTNNNTNTNSAATLQEAETEFARVRQMI